MSKKNPITVSSWTLGDQCKFEDRVIAAKDMKESVFVQRLMLML